MRTLVGILVIAALAGIASADVNVTGNWSGTFNISGPNGETKESTALLVLKQEGNQISGTVGPDEGERFDIRKGTIEGDKITLEADHDGHLLKFSLLLAADRITGDATMEGQELKAKLDVKRAK